MFSRYLNILVLTKDAFVIQFIKNLLGHNYD